MATIEECILVPGHMQLKSLYTNLFKTLCKNVLQKLRYNNSMRSNIANPHMRTITLNDVHKIVFAGAYGHIALQEEKVVEGVNLLKSSPIFKIETLGRVNKVFSSGIVKCHKSGDASIISPRFLFTNVIEKGQLLLPMDKCTVSNTLKFFVLCAGFDPSTDTLLDWIANIRLTHNISDIDIPSLSLKNLTSHREGKLSALRNTDYTSIESGQVMVGDFVIVRGEWKEVYAFNDDAFYPEGTRNSTRFTKNFKNNVSKQPFHIAKIVCLQTLFWIQCSFQQYAQENVVCKYCFSNVKFYEDVNQRQGQGTKLLFRCMNNTCFNNTSNRFYSTEKTHGKNQYQINNLVVLGMRAIGKGRRSTETFFYHKPWFRG